MLLSQRKTAELLRVPRTVLYQEIMFYLCRWNFIGWKQQFCFPGKNPFPNLPICSVQLQHKGPSHFTSSLHPEGTIWQGLSKFCMTGAYGAFAANLAPVVTLFPGLFFIIILICLAKCTARKNTYKNLSHVCQNHVSVHTASATAKRHGLIQLKLWILLTEKRYFPGTNSGLIRITGFQQREKQRPNGTHV